MKITADTVIESYVETRNQIKELEEQISTLKGFQTKKEEWLLSQLVNMGAESIKSKHGTVYTIVAESVTVSEPDVFFEWVKENDRFDCLEKRAAKTAILQEMGDREDTGRPNPPPPGLSYIAIKKIGVRKA